MQIEIAERLKPFSHQPNTYAVVPGSSLRLQIFPTLIRIEDLTQSFPKLLSTITFEVYGPLADFTVVQDLEKGHLHVYGKNTLGHFGYFLKAIKGGSALSVRFDKLPSETIRMAAEGEWSLIQNVKKGDEIILGSERETHYQIPKIDRLSLGNNKAQDFELIKRRLDFAEIFPIWHRLGQMIVFPNTPTQSPLIDACMSAIAANAPELILGHFERLFRAGFEGILSPRGVDTDFQGILAPFQSINGTNSSLHLLSIGSEMIRSLFIQQEVEQIKLLPALPPSFHCGRLTNVVNACGVCSLEWTKKSMRQFIMEAKTSGSLTLKCYHDEKSCRMRTSNADKGQRYLIGTPFEVVSGQNYWFDNFER